jgi:hypothetical protein
MKAPIGQEKTNTAEQSQQNKMNSTLVLQNLKPLGEELSTQVSSMTKSLGDDAAAQGQLQGAVKALQGDNGGSSLSALQKLSQANSTRRGPKAGRS